MNNYLEVVSFLEGLQMMPKTMPGLVKIETALKKTNWFSELDPSKVIIVAGTNGKGTTCAALEILLMEQGQQVGLYTSPHLVSTTERIRFNKNEITEDDFVRVFRDCEQIIKNCELTHFEALTFMMGHYFFSGHYIKKIDFAILEVGLGGLYDATNAFPHKYSVITKIGLDHTNILGNNLKQIAENKFGIVKTKNIVIHHSLPPEIQTLKTETQKNTNSNWIEADPAILNTKFKNNQPYYQLEHMGNTYDINLIGPRAAENIMTAIQCLQAMGFQLPEDSKALSNIKWYGRMQKIEIKGMKCPVYLSGDHNEQGIESLLEILKDFKWKRLHLVVGIGQDKDASRMLEKLMSLKNMDLYLTETTFKPCLLGDYPKFALEKSVFSDSDIKNVLHQLTEKSALEDLVLVTGSLYLVGLILKITNYSQSKTTISL